MSIDVKLKHSATPGKKPSAGDLTAGELAINTADEVAYIKNASGDVVALTGSGSIPSYPNVDDGGGATLDARYVKTTGDATAQEITGTGGLKTEGLIESEGGVKVTGGSDAAVDTGMWGNSSLNLTLNGETQVSFSDDRAARTCPDRAGTSIGWEANGAFTKAVTQARPFTSYINSAVSAVSEITHFEADQGSAVVGGTVKGFSANENLQNGTTASYGFYSNLATSTGPANYNFFAAASASNFLKGSTYIGGSVSRNTLELWKSTLTEEQLEALEAGTLVAPANVATPGDGEFARQWWYNQQDEDTQAELGAGTQEYPTHLLAANFIDNFVLGALTKINLLSNGKAYFDSASGGNQVVINSTNAQVSDSNKALAVSNGGTETLYISYRGQIEADNYEITTAGEFSGLSVNVEETGEFGPSAGDANATVVATHMVGRNNAFSANGRTTDTGQSAGFISYISPAAGIDANQIIGFNVSSRTFEGTATISKGFSVTDAIAQATFNYGYYSEIADKANAYNFYAAGTAPNYFAGLVEGAGGVKVSDASAGLILTSPDGSGWRLTVDNAGVLTTAAV